MEKVNMFKGAVSALVAACTALWGWFGWLVVAWVICMGLDYITGTVAALLAGEWSSKVARDGIGHKMGCACAVVMAWILDWVVGQILGHLPGVALPFTYTVLLCPLVIVWYILTEAGSIIENAGHMGAPIPPWLKKAIAAFQDKVDEAMMDEAMLDKHGEEE